VLAEFDSRIQAMEVSRRTNDQPRNIPTCPRACCANQTNALFLKLAGPQLVQMSIEDGANAKIEQGVSAGAILLLLMKLMPLVGLHYDTGNTSTNRPCLLRLRREK
jgi:hypothetical protein